MSEPQSRTEYRVVGDRDGKTVPLTANYPYLNTKGLGDPALWPSYTNVRVQKSEFTETRTPWEDVQDGD